MIRYECEISIVMSKSFILNTILKEKLLIPICYLLQYSTAFDLEVGTKCIYAGEKPN